MPHGKTVYKNFPIDLRRRNNRAVLCKRKLCGGFGVGAQAGAETGYIRAGIQLCTSMIKSPAGLASREAHKKINHFNCNRPRGCCQMKKYELTEETTNIFGKTLHRIRATRDFSNGHAGDLGGFIEDELN